MMIDYTSITKIIQSKQYVDITQHFARFWDFQHETLVNCKDTGSSLFLKTFACFLDENADTKEVFRNLAIGKNSEFMKHANSYRVLYFDFSDFNADNIYRYFQKIQDNESIVSSNNELETILESLPDQNPKWKSTGWISNTGSWTQAVYSRRDKKDGGSPAKPEGLKVYVCLKDASVEEIFVESLKYLLNHSIAAVGQM